MPKIIWYNVNRCSYPYGKNTQTVYAQLVINGSLPINFVKLSIELGWLSIDKTVRYRKLRKAIYYTN